MSGFQTVWANDIMPDACETFAANHGPVIRCGPLEHFVSELNGISSPDVLIGGPPCQGFSVAGKMDPSDPRSQLVYTFMEAVRRVRPRAFVMENVKALARLEKFRAVRERLIREATAAGYDCSLVVLRASDYGVPQGRERMFLVGFRDGISAKNFSAHIMMSKKSAPTLREVITPLGKAGSRTNSRVCKAKVTIAAKPVLRRSPYAGMMFNGQGRPLNPNGYASTLPASMGGNRTPIVDEPHLFGEAESWIEEYHTQLWNGGKSLPFEAAPSRLRRLTIDECILIQTFPLKYNFKGKNSSIFTQIGNAVPCELAHHVAESVKAVLDGYISNLPSRGQIDLELMVA
jgi:DNA (cytosine-5)-methyltransferase 1